jgi:hypothetical protein
LLPLQLSFNFYYHTGPLLEGMVQVTSKAETTKGTKRRKIQLYKKPAKLS